MILVIVLSVMFAFVPFGQAGTWEYDFTKIKGNEWEKDWEVIDGEFDVVDGALKQTAQSADDNNAFRAIALTKWEIQNGIIEAKVKHSGAGNNDALIFYRMEDNDNGYASRLQLDGYITIGKITNGVHGHIQFVVTPVQADVWYIVKIELDGDTITVSVDDKEFIILQDKTSPSGSVGFGMSRCAGGASLEWIHVTGSGVTPTLVAPAGKLTTTWANIKAQ
ncbi:MAG: family 16 glycoside hydrolase [Candidatus Doudnabacteria bacterium]